MMRRYGLIGYPLGHSYSAEVFKQLFQRDGVEAEFELYPETNIENAWQRAQTLDGCMVTIPYKKAIIPYLSHLEEQAREIGAVNMIMNGKGYNTDWIGFKQCVAQAVKDMRIESALILGSGGGAQAVKYALSTLMVSAQMVSRTTGIGQWTYAELREDMIRAHRLIVNATSLGMWPKVEEKPDIPYGGIGKNHLLVDLSYNPAITAFMQEGMSRGANVMNGKEMLIAQAEAAWQIFCRLES